MGNGKKREEQQRKEEKNPTPHFSVPHPQKETSLSLKALGLRQFDTGIAVPTD